VFVVVGEVAQRDLDRQPDLGGDDLGAQGIAAGDLGLEPQCEGAGRGIVEGQAYLDRYLSKIRVIPRFTHWFSPAVIRGVCRVPACKADGPSGHLRGSRGLLASVATAPCAWSPVPTSDIP
jgi:hypothetical protein